MPRFVNTRLLSPVVLEGFTRAPETSREYHEWWSEQDRRCKQGFTAGDIAITGRHYYYLNFHKIRGKQKTGGKVLLPPRFLDIDYDFFWQLEECFEKGKNGLWLKRRQAGYSYKNSGVLCHQVSFVPYSHSMILAAHEHYAKQTFDFARGGLNELADTAFYKHRIPDTDTYLRMAVEENSNGRKRMRGYMSVLERRTAASPQVAVGTSCNIILYEEIGKFKGLIDTVAYNEPSMHNEGSRTGVNLLIGTGGEENESIGEVEEIFYNPDRYDMACVSNTWDAEEYAPMDDVGRNDLKPVCFFVPGYLYHKIDEDGNSLVEESKRDILDRRERAKGNAQFWLKEVTQFPLTPAEALMVPDGNRFNIQKLRERKSTLMRSRVLSDQVMLGDIQWIRDAQGSIIDAEWIPDQVNGRYRMTEAPSMDPISKKARTKVYVAGTDSYDQDRTADVKRQSFGSCYIYKTFVSPDESDSRFVCSLTERPATSEEFYEDTAKMCVLYGWASNLIEYSNKLIFDWYTHNGFTRLLKERPEIAYSATIKSNAQNRWGIETTTKAFWIQALADNIEEHWENYMDPLAIDRLIRYKSDPDYNCDDTIAMALAVVNAKEYIRILDRPKREQFSFKGYAYTGDGRIVSR